jgi:hypothetical protein
MNTDERIDYAKRIITPTEYSPTPSEREIQLAQTHALIAIAEILHGAHQR